MKHLATPLLAILLLGVVPTQAQPDTPMLITLGEDGLMIQSAPDATPEPLNVQLADDSFYRPVISADQRYVAENVYAPEYFALPEDEQTAIHSLPENIVVIDLQTGEKRIVAGQSENFPDDPWVYRSEPVWSPTTNQLVFAEVANWGASLQLYDADSQTRTTLADSLPMGYSDAGMIGIPTVHWSEIGVYSLETNVAPDGIGFAQTLTVIDPTGQEPVVSMVVGRTLSGGESSRDTVEAYAAGIDEDGEPILLMLNAEGEWFIKPLEGFGRVWRGTPILRPSGGGDIQLYFAQTTALDPEQRRGYPVYRTFIRRGDDALQPLSGRSSSYFLNTLNSQNGMGAAPDGSSVLFYDGDAESFVQWFGPDDIRPVDLDGRRIVDWGDWVLQAQDSCFRRPNLTVINGPQTVQMIHDEPVDLYSAPGKAANEIGALQPGDTVRVVTGPLCVDGSNWYEVAVTEDSYGWVEGTGKRGYRFEPLY